MAKKWGIIKQFKEMRAHHQILFSLLIGFAVISFWRGVWELWDLYVFPNNYHLSLWASLLTGVAILVVTRYTTKELT